MKRRALLLITLLTLLLTAIVLVQAGWLATRSADASRRVEVRSHAKVQEILSTEAGLRWRHGQPTHWRACLLQH